MRGWLLAGALLLGACGSPQTYRDLDRMGAEYRRDAAYQNDTCGMASQRQLIGIDQTAIDRTSLPRGTRVICHNCAVTLDYLPARLNILLDAGGKVESMRCG